MRLSALPLGLAVLVLVAGCGGSDDTPTSDASTSASPSATASTSPSPEDSEDEPTGPPGPADMEAALPKPDQVPQGDADPARCSFGKVTSSCPKRQGTTYASVWYTLAGSGDKDDIKQREGTHWQAETASLEVYRYASVKVAQRLLGSAAKQARSSAGTIDVAPRTTSSTQYSLGTQGTSEFADVRPGDGVRGYLVDSEIRYTSPEGRTSAPYTGSFGIFRVDRYLVVANAARWASSQESADELTRTLVKEYVDRVT